MMRHKKYENMIILAFYEEITADEKAALNNHLDSCPKCRDYMMRLAKSFPEKGVREEAVSGEFIDRARRDLHRALEEDRSEGAGRQTVMRLPARRNWLSAGVPAYAFGIAALVMLAVGIASGYFLFGGRNTAAGGMRSVLSEISARNSEDIAIADVRFLTSDKESGDVRFSFNLIRRYEMSGSLDNKSVQKVLAYALVNSDNAGVRLRSIGMLDASPKPDREIEDALIKALKTDGNAGVRRKALLSLDKLPFDHRIKEALLFVLQNDKNPGMRVAAINSLSTKELKSAPEAAAGKGIDPKLLDVLREKSSSDQNRYVRLKASDMLKELKEL